MPSSSISGRARIRALASFASWSAAETQSASHAGQIIALPWLLTHSAHQPLPHWVQMPRDAVDGCVAQRRQALPLARAGRAEGAAGRATGGAGRATVAAGGPA